MIPESIFEPEQERQLKELMSTYKGDAALLGNAVGALVTGRLYGWRVVRLLYTSVTYTKYQKALGIDFKKWCPETTALSDRSRAYSFVVKAGRFWDFVRGRSLPQEYLDSRKELA
jgi:hypothetical protein